MTTTTTRPACRDCHAPADLTVVDPGHGYANRGTHSPHRPICTDCLEQLRAAETGDPWPIWTNPHVIARHQETTMPELADTLAPLADRYLALNEQKARIEEQLEEIKAAIRDLTPGADTYAAGDHVVVIAANRRFDEKRALELVGTGTPLADLVTVPRTTVDKDKLRVLAPEIFEAAQVVYAERITVKAAG